MGKIELNQLPDGRFQMVGDMRDIEVLYEALLLVSLGADVPEGFRNKAVEVEERIYHSVLISGVGSN